MTTVLLRGVSERDLDLLLVEELVASPAFRAWFSTQIGLPASSQLEHVARSVMTSTGESDLELTYREPDDTRTRVLVENKIDAVLQPRQPERYAERAAGYIAAGECHRVVTVLVAPQAYLAGAVGFDQRLVYEVLREWFADTSVADERAMYKRHLLDAAIERGTSGWTLVPDDTANAFWLQYWETARAYAPELGMPKPSPKPATSWFVRFLSPTLGRRVYLIHKVPYGHVDLQFAGMAAKAEEFAAAYQGRLDPTMHIAVANKSLVVRIAVERGSLDAPPDRRLTTIQDGIAAAKRLLIWHGRVIAPSSDPGQASDQVAAQ